jgi:uncharacterized membrane protein YdcZ (DUF606 family)
MQISVTEQMATHRISHSVGETILVLIACIQDCKINRFFDFVVYPAMWHIFMV